MSKSVFVLVLPRTGWFSSDRADGLKSRKGLDTSEGQKLAVSVCDPMATPLLCRPPFLPYTPPQNPETANPPNPTHIRRQHDYTQNPHFKMDDTLV